MKYTRHVHSLVSSINSTLHGMQRVVEDLRRPTCGYDRYSGCGTGRYDRGYGYGRFRRW